MVQVLRRYIPFSRIVDFMVHSMLCAMAFTVVVQVALYLPRLVQATVVAALTLALLYQVVPTVALGWCVAGGSLCLMTTLMVGWHLMAPLVVRDSAMVENVLILGECALAAQPAAKIMAGEPGGFHLSAKSPWPTNTIWEQTLRAERVLGTRFPRRVSGRARIRTNPRTPAFFPSRCRSGSMPGRSAACRTRS